MTQPETLIAPETDEIVEGPICGACDAPCKVIVADQGIGAYEFWGSKGTDVDLQAVSDCCEYTAYTDSSKDEVCEAEGPDDYYPEPDDYDDEYDAFDDYPDEDY